MRYRSRGRFFPGMFAGLILLLIGCSIVLHMFFPFYHYGFFPWGGFFFWPGFLFFGLIFFIGRRFFWGHHGWGYAGPGYGHRGPWQQRQFHGHRFGNQPFEKVGSKASDDFIELTTGFGWVEKKITSKNFQGGDVTTLMGETVIDLRDADFSGNVRLKLTQARGATTVIVPATWEVKTEIDTVSAGFRDNRSGKTVNPDKILTIEGTCIMGGIEVRTN